MNNFVTAQVIRQNEAEFATAIVKPIPTLHTAPHGVWWRVPVSDTFGQFLRYDYRDGSADKPSEDSAKVLLLRDNEDMQYFYILIADDDTAQVWADAVNSDDPEDAILPTISLPELISEEKGTADGSDNYNYIWVGAPLEDGQEYEVTGSVNGESLADLGDTFATIADVVTAANSSWSAAGTWSNPSGNVLKLVSTDAVSAGVSITGTFAT